VIFIFQKVGKQDEACNDQTKNNEGIKQYYITKNEELQV